jgi:cell wall-associated NlpC family hydrolase
MNTGRISRLLRRLFVFLGRTSPKTIGENSGPNDLLPRGSPPGQAKTTGVICCTTLSRDLHSHRKGRTQIMLGWAPAFVITSTSRLRVGAGRFAETTSSSARRLLIYKRIQASSLRIKCQSLVRKKITPLTSTLRSRTVQTLLALCAAACLPACAAPKAPGDPVIRFLRERGLMETQAAGSDSSGLFGSVRNHASDLVMTAMNFLGVPYRYGGTSEESGFDCSGFTRHVFETSLGMILPRRAEEQAQAVGMLNIHPDELKPGDLVFFNTMRRAFSHVGIYVGDGKFIHAPRTGSTVRVEDMRQAYWTARFNGARRAPDVAAGTLQGQFPTSTLPVTSAQTP